MIAILEFLAALAPAIVKFYEAVQDRDDEAERQALMDMSRAAHDERARRELGP